MNLPGISRVVNVKEQGCHTEGCHAELEEDCHAGLDSASMNSGAWIAGQARNDSQGVRNDSLLSSFGVALNP